MKHRWLTCGILLALLGALLPWLATGIPAAAQSSDEPLCFAQTTECIAGPIRDYWEQNGGLPVFGLPITPLRTETIDGWTGPTQWFERDRLENHGAQGVLAGRLGVELLEQQGRPWQTAFERIPATLVPDDCAYFAETGHSLCEPFLSHWLENGQVERFGYPITEPFQERIDDWNGTVQYFERRRMEFHPDLPGSPILLGLLGNEIQAGVQPVDPYEPVDPDNPDDPALPDDDEDLADGPIPACIEPILAPTSPNRRALRTAYEQLPFREALGCPLIYLPNINASNQYTERGQMLWIDLLNRGVSPAPQTMANRFIYTIFNGNQSYQRYIDTWVAGVDPLDYDLETPDDGLYVPWGGFGKLWINDATVRSRLGWAIEERAREDLADVVIFDNIYRDPGNLGVMVLFQENGTVYAFGRLDQPDEVQIVFGR
jgi:hypothetical protein